MRRKLPALFSSLLLAACEGAAAPPAEPQPVAAQLRVGFPARGLVDTIEIHAVERLPLRVAELVAPDGKATAAGYLNVAGSPGIDTGQWAGANAWQDAVTGNDALAALTLQRTGGAALYGQQQLLATVSTAEITLPDPVAYRRDWQHYRIRLSFGTPPGEVEAREIPAPAPPPK